MDNGQPTNGAQKPHEHYTQLVLTLDVQPTWHLHIAGNMESADVALAVLHQAVRYFDSVLRAQAAIDLQKQLADAKRTSDLVSGLKFPR